MKDPDRWGTRLGGIIVLAMLALVVRNLVVFGSIIPPSSSSDREAAMPSTEL